MQEASVFLVLFHIQLIKHTLVAGTAFFIEHRAEVVALGTGGDSAGQHLYAQLQTAVIRKVQMQLYDHRVLVIGVGVAAVAEVAQRIEHGHRADVFHLHKTASLDTQHRVKAHGCQTVGKAACPIGDLSAVPVPVYVGHHEAAFGTLIIKGLHQSLSLDQDQKLKRAPLGFDPDGAYIEYVKLKNFCLSGTYDDSSLDIDLVLKVFKTAKPFLDYINRAIEFSREESS